MASGKPSGVSSPKVAGLAAITLLLFASPAFAHKPLDVSNNNDLASAQEILDHQVSWAIYEDLGASGGAKYYKFSARAGARFFGEI